MGNGVVGDLHSQQQAVHVQKLAASAARLQDRNKGRK